MKIFLSWSGEQSKAVAVALREWLPRVIQASQPWISATDIDKGVRWRTEVARQLDEAVVGIICLTQTNLESPWLLFEAGAISRKAEECLVCTYLFNLEPSDIKDPLAQFQSTKAQKEDTWKLIQSINNIQRDTALPKDILIDVFNAMWPKLETILTEIKGMDARPRTAKPQEEILEELVGLAYSQIKGLENLREDVLDLITIKNDRSPLKEGPAYQKILGLHLKVKQLNDDIYSVIESHTAQPDIHIRLQSIHDEVHVLLNNKHEYKPYTKQLLNLALAIKRLANNLSEAEDIAHEWRQGAIETNLE